MRVFLPKRWFTPVMVERKTHYEKPKMNKYHGYYCGMPNKS
jgi:hypothetical protein